MTYKDHFVVEVKYKGKILRVRNDIVNLPFGSEYSLYLKNLSSKKASVNISIDGNDVLDNSSLVLQPNSSTELEGFLTGSAVKNKFKFIQKTKEIQEYRGDRVDDGIIRVEFAYEKNKPVIINEYRHHTYDVFHWNYNNWFSGDSTARYGSFGSTPVASNSLNSYQPSVYSSQVVNEVVNNPLPDEGITVKGSECRQDFQYTTIGELEQSEVIIIRLKGITEDSYRPVQAPITVETKLTCSTCGRVSRSSFKFCPNCGTFLE